MTEALTCLCPTYGRWTRLRDAVACFLLQDYPGEATLLILNDAVHPIALGDARPVPGRAIRSVHSRGRFANLGAKRQALLEAASTSLVAHWDDDDLYLPWHLSEAVAALSAPPGQARPSCAKSHCGWWALGRRECWELQGGVHHNTFEGQMVFRRERALELGGYPPKMSGQAADLLAAFRRAGELNLYRPADGDVSYVYRWADGVGHVSACSGQGATHQREWNVRNPDFGHGPDGLPLPLIPSSNARLWAAAHLAGQFHVLLNQLQPRLALEAWQRASDRITQALECSLAPCPQPPTATGTPGGGPPAPAHQRI